MKWKSRILSSGIPLEIDVCHILARRNYFIENDFKYTKYTGTEYKDFSVDIEATGYSPLESPDTVKAQLSILIECKYRLDHKKWLFFDSPNPVGDEYRKHIYTLRAIDHFSIYNFDPCCTCILDDKLTHSVKAIEVDTEKGEVNPKSIITGINQLQYALPDLLSSYIKYALESNKEDIIPFFFCPILVTNATLYRVTCHKNCETISSCASLDEFSETVPFICYSQSFSPGFSSHSRSVFKKIQQPPNYRNIGKIKRMRMKKINSNRVWNDPEELIENLIASKQHTQRIFFSNFIICNLHYLEKLLEDIELVIETIC